MQNTLPIHFAPLQGYTKAIYRNAHDAFFGGVDTYYTPFVRLEKGNFRRERCPGNRTREQWGAPPDSSVDSLVGRESRSDFIPFHRKRISGSGYKPRLSVPASGETS